MNTQLEKLFEKHHISPKDRYEINQIYGLLPDPKRQNLLNNFDNLALRLKQIEEEINTEREILLGGLFDDIDRAIERERRMRLVLKK